MFDTINGLPVHALVVHAVVVLLPLMSIVTFAVAVRRQWRGAVVPVVVIDAGVVVAAFVAKESGEALQHRLSSLGGTLIAKEHGEKGSLIPLFALALFLAAVLVWFAGRRPALTVPAVVVTGLAAAAAIGWTVVTGDSGAHAVWADLIKSTKG